MALLNQNPAFSTSHLRNGASAPKVEEDVVR